MDKAVQSANAIVLLQVLRAFGSVELDPDSRVKFEVHCGRQQIRKMAREMPGQLERYRFPEFIRGYERSLCELVQQERARVDQGTM